MQMLPLPIKCSSVMLRAALLATLALAGCASRNPLIDAPAGPATPPTSASVLPAPTTSETTSAATADSGLQRTTPTSVRRFFGVVSPYRVDLPQGNFVSEEMLSQLKVGMTPDQVRFALGTPLITDVFHAERWDYVFRMLKTNDEVLSSRVTVFFKDGVMSRSEGGNLPGEADYLALIAGAVPKKTNTQVPPAHVAEPSAARPTQ